MFDTSIPGLTFSDVRHDPTRPVAISVRDVNFWYGEKHALIDVSIDIPMNEVTAFIGPSGCGKSTLLKCLNRMHDVTPGARMTGAIRLFGEDVNGEEIDPPLLRRRFGWVAQKPNPFPWSIRENIVYGARIAGQVWTRTEEDETTERCLRAAALWDEVKDRLKEPGTDLSGGQQQRLCIARALATKPDVLLMDEPCSAIDPIAAARVEDLIHALREDCAIVIITHNMEQAARIAQKTAYFHLGRLLEEDDTRRFFEAPKTMQAEAYLAGRFG